MVQYSVGLIVKKIAAQSVLSKSGIPGADYCINPYVGCSHACRYCYASFMKRFTGHTEPWGSFVDIKINAPEVLRKQLRRAAKGTVMISSVTDAYQPLESRYRLTRECLIELLPHQFPVDILTKSPLVLRDIDIFRKFRELDVGITITTDDDRIRRTFEPKAPPIGARIATLRKLHESGIKTYVFIGPVLPMNPEALCRDVKDYADSVLISRMNYISKTVAIYRKLKLEQWLDRGHLDDVVKRLRKGLSRKAVMV